MYDYRMWLAPFPPTSTPHTTVNTADSNQQQEHRARCNGSSGTWKLCHGAGLHRDANRVIGLQAHVTSAGPVRICYRVVTVDKQVILRTLGILERVFALIYFTARRAVRLDAVVRIADVDVLAFVVIALKVIAFKVIALKVIALKARRPEDAGPAPTAPRPP